MRLKEHGQRTVEMKKDRFKEVFNFLTLKPPEPVIKKNFFERNGRTKYDPFSYPKL